ncbi:hypothetical protein FJZ21_00870 [Candidatus Pacearchaeota archaeon]|nr:hypothetical protein [Candidatus Pacearchaeota archaeon]
MADLKKVLVVILVVTLVLSALSVVFNLTIYNMKSSNNKEMVRPSSNYGNVGFFVETSNKGVQSGNGG